MADNHWLILILSWYSYQMHVDNTKNYAAVLQNINDTMYALQHIFTYKCAYMYYVCGQSHHPFGQRIIPNGTSC